MGSPLPPGSKHMREALAPQSQLGGQAEISTTPPASPAPNESTEEQNTARTAVAAHHEPALLTRAWKGPTPTPAPHVPRVRELACAQGKAEQSPREAVRLF